LALKVADENGNGSLELHEAAKFQSMTSAGSYPNIAKFFKEVQNDTPIRLGERIHARTLQELTAVFADALSSNDQKITRLTLQSIVIMPFRAAPQGPVVIAYRGYVNIELENGKKEEKVVFIDVIAGKLLYSDVGRTE